MAQFMGSPLFGFMKRKNQTKFYNIYRENNSPASLDRLVREATGAKKVQYDKDGQTLLGRAIIDGQTELAVKLIDAHELCINHPSKTGMYPIHIATLRCRVNILKELLANDADINAQEKRNGNTALHIALCQEKPNAEVVKVLLENNPNHCITNKDGESAVALAAKYQRIYSDEINPLLKSLLSDISDLKERLARVECRQDGQEARIEDMDGRVTTLEEDRNKMQTNLTQLSDHTVAFQSAILKLAEDRKMAHQSPHGEPDIEAELIDHNTRAVLKKNMPQFVKNVKIKRVLVDLYSVGVLSDAEYNEANKDDADENKIAEKFYLNLMRGSRSLLRRAREVFQNEGQECIAQLIPQVQEEYMANSVLYQWKF